MNETENAHLRECIRMAQNHLRTIAERNAQRLNEGKRINMLMDDQIAISGALSWLRAANRGGSVR